MADIDTGNGETLVTYAPEGSEGAAQLRLLGLPSKTYTSTSKGSDIGSSYNLGAGILDSFDMVLDASKGDFCLVEPRAP
ncbi:hypothetical protein MP631_18510 [Xanthomonas phaseoli pv. phaseoli]|nr:hypothetical protein MP631_18510 [Xanthomonas phaseoli pv. phaseoli]